MSTENLSAAGEPAGDGRADALAALSAELAHDLNNVLSAVLMTVDLLEGICTRERERKVLAAVEESARRGIALGRRLLRLSRGEEEAPSEGAAEARVGSPEMPARATGGGRILVVESDGAVREAIAGVLEKHGYQAQTATDGAEAVALFAHDPQAIAAVVAAADLPYLDGRGTLRAMRRWRETVPAVLTGTAGNLAGLAVDADSAVPVLLEKPFAAAALLAAVRRAMG